MVKGRDEREVLEAFWDRLIGEFLFLSFFRFL